MEKRILIVEDDLSFREALRDVLKKKYQISEAENGLKAKEILLLQEFDLVLSDVQMPSMNGIELLEWSKKNRPVPFIIMTGFSMILETQSAFDLGAKGFLAKPFRTAELMQTVEQILFIGGDTEAASTPDLTKDYCKVSIEEFVSRPKIEFDVYIKLSDTKIIKIAHKGQEIPREKVEHYKFKGLKYLYILKEDFGKLVNFNMNLAKVMKDRSDISSEKKLNFLKYTGEVILEKTFVDGVDRASFHDAKSFLEITLNVVTEESECADLLSLLNSHSDHVYAHSLGVAIYSVMIARALGLESQSVLFRLSLAGLFHDIGKKEIDRELLEKPRHMCTREEQRLIESHVVRGQEILVAMSTIPSEVVQMVLEHHEDNEGLGYPFGKRKVQLHPLTRILHCANIFIENTLSTGSGQVKTPAATIEWMEKIYERRISTDCLGALKTLFQIKA